MKVAITGSAGFVATWLARELAAHGHDVVGADLADGVDLRDWTTLRRWVKAERPDVIWHTAAQVGRLFGEDDASHTVRANAELTTLVARVAGDYGIRLAYTSTSEVYGDQGDAVVDEVDGPFGLPHNLYGLSKRWGEEACRLYAPDGLVIARLSMPYGPGVPPGRGRRAMDTFCWQAHHRIPLTVHRGAERSWCWVGDTVAALRLMVEQPDAGVWNVGRDDDPRTMMDLAIMACDLAGAPYDVIEIVDPPHRQTVVKRLATARVRALGWRPVVDLEDGMAKVYEHVVRYDRAGVLA